MSHAPPDLRYYTLLWMLATAIQLITAEDLTTGVLSQVAPRAKQEKECFRDYV